MEVGTESLSVIGNSVVTGSCWKVSALHPTHTNPVEHCTETFRRAKLNSVIEARMHIVSHLRKMRTAKLNMAKVTQHKSMSCVLYAVYSKYH